MKGNVNTSKERAENQDAIKKINKNVSEWVRRIDRLVSSARSCDSLFSMEAIHARVRLQDCCEKVIVQGPSNMRQGIEEVLWRKVFYDTFSHAKKIKKNSCWTMNESGLVWSHLNGGIAFYHHLMMTQAVYSKLTYIHADFIFFNDQGGWNALEAVEPGLRESFYRSFTCLGDLTRYLADITSTGDVWDVYCLSIRYYQQALYFNGEAGLTHSNLAAVYTAYQEPLLATIHYLRALSCKKSFDAAESNLKRLLEKSRLAVSKIRDLEISEKEETLAQLAEKKIDQNTTFMHLCLALISCFVNDKPLEQVAKLCQSVLVKLSTLLDEFDMDADPPSVGSDHNKNTKREGEEQVESVFIFAPESMMAICCLFMVCADRMSNQGSVHTSMAEVLVVSILLTLVSNSNTRIEQALSLNDPSFVKKLMPQLTKGETPPEATPFHICNGNDAKLEKPQLLKSIRKSSLPRGRRRRRRRAGAKVLNGYIDSASSDSSACESSDNSFLSDSGHSESFGSSDDDDEDVRIESEDEWSGLSVREHAAIVSREVMLPAIHLVFQWIIQKENVIRTCSSSGQSLWKEVARLYNLTNFDAEVLAKESYGLKKNILENFVSKPEVKKSDERKNNNDVPNPLPKAEPFGSIVSNGNVLNSLDKSKKNVPSKITPRIVVKSNPLNAESVKAQVKSLKNEVKTPIDMLPLPEDLMMKSLLSSIENLERNQKDVGREAALLRMCRLRKLVTRLAAREDTPLRRENSIMVVQEQVKRQGTPTNVNDGESKMSKSAQMSIKGAGTRGSTVTASMQALTAQWLQHEVKNLEERTSRRSILSGNYLVPDAAVLTNYLADLKRLFGASNNHGGHIVIIPQSVIERLDQQKKESVGAREAIRWLENKLRHGSRFMRAQRAHERTRIPLVRYPKRKDKEGLFWFNLCEVCLYLSGHSTGLSPDSKPKVTLLTGLPKGTLQNMSFSPHTLAQTSGATLEHLDDFIRKWKTSQKGNS